MSDCYKKKYIFNSVLKGVHSEKYYVLTVSVEHADEVWCVSYLPVARNLVMIVNITSSISTCPVV
jgi:hypothetical protein